MKETQGNGHWYHIPLDLDGTIILDVYKHKEEVKIYYKGSEIPNDL